MRWYLEEYWKWPYEEFAIRGQQIEALLPALGKRLYEAVFGSVKAERTFREWHSNETPLRQITIVSDIPHVLSLPWELLHDAQGFLALDMSHPISILRRLSRQEQAALPTPFESPLRVLLVTARPIGAGFLDPRGIARELVKEVQSQVEGGDIELEFLRPPTLSALRIRLENSERPIHILHFDGHGTFSQGEGMLAFEDAGERLNWVKASHVAQVLQGRGVQLVILTACQSAVSAADDAFSSVAARLIQGDVGVDAVVAMSASILAISATRYVKSLYRALAEGLPAPIAQERARIALHNDPRRHPHSPHRDEEGIPVELHDWWLPHFYQRRPVALQPTKARRKSKKLRQAPPSRRLSEEMPAEPRYGFSGRARELLQLERCLMRGKLVMIHGFGGIGKTTLVRESADWLTRTHLYDGACFVSFEHGGDATTLLRMLGHFLGVYDGHYNPNDSKAALERLEPILKKKRTLVIADNLESILPNGNVPLDVKAQRQLWDVLVEVAKMGAGILLTSRDTVFGDGRPTQGNKVAYLNLGGLHRDDAYALATRLLNSLEIDRKRVPYAELCDLLSQLDYHPLAIQLVLPALQKLPLSRIRADFAALLNSSTFVDDTVTGRNRSLSASLDYSLKRLNEEQRALLPRLAPFEGGVWEGALLDITEIPKSEWIELRSTLEQAALLTAEQDHAVFVVPYLHFHPVLAPFLRTQPSGDNKVLRERYAQKYYELANSLYYTDDRNPQGTRALVSRELPNLKRALDLLLQAGELDAASNMADSVVKFLTIFGLGREREELRRRVDEAVVAARDQVDGALTWEEWLRESGIGEDEWRTGKLHHAYTRFSSLLKRIEALPQGRSLGRGSYEHCVTLTRLARCLPASEQADTALKLLREALAVIDTLITQQPDNKGFARHLGALLTDLGTVLLTQGHYLQAREMYEEALEVDKQLGDLRNQAVDLGQLGALALTQRDYAEAHSRYTEALAIFRLLNEQVSEAHVWHQLGIVAQSQNEWTEAERCYRESLALHEQLEDTSSAAKACNQLAIIAEHAGRHPEAEGWYKRALERYERLHSSSLEQAIILSNLATLLLREVRGGSVPVTRLVEARDYAERALAI